MIDENHNANEFSETDVHPTRFWHLLPDGRTQCDLCPRKCKLHEGQRGLCFVRACYQGKIVLTTYGRSSGFCVDPIEKKPLNHFYPGAPVLSFGTAGCNLACKFCQNWDISKSREMDRLMDQASPEQIAQAALQTGCKSVAYTYNDPVIFHEYAIDVAHACHAVGLKNVAVTAGYICAEPRVEFFKEMDAVNVDLKAFTEEFYWKITGSHLDAVLETLQYIKHETNVWLELTTLLIPGFNDDDSSLHTMSQWVLEHLGLDVPMHFSAFHPDYKMLDTPPTPVETLLRARQIAKDHGIRYAYIGNAHAKAADSTYCHQCGALLIGRDWYELSDWTLDAQGRCQRCATPLAGHFDATPGSWGAKRLPVRLS